MSANALQSPTPISPPVGTPDRLAEPTLPPAPSQADKGSQVYWLSCLPCHGDRGQGLTEEFRNAYPEEDRYCWNSGCHGKNPYESGFTLPEHIPAVVGPGTLQKFENAAILRSYIFSAMPYWDPGSLTEEQTWQVTAYILRQNGLWDAREELNASNAGLVRVGPPAATPTSQPPAPANTSAPAMPVIGAAALIIILLVVLQFARMGKKNQ